MSSCIPEDFFHLFLRDSLQSTRSLSVLLLLLTLASSTDPCLHFRAIDPRVDTSRITWGRKPAVQNALKHMPSLRPSSEDENRPPFAADLFGVTPDRASAVSTSTSNIAGTACGYGLPVRAPVRSVGRTPFGDVDENQLGKEPAHGEGRVYGGAGGVSQHGAELLAGYSACHKGEVVNGASLLVGTWPACVSKSVFAAANISRWQSCSVASNSTHACC